MKIVNKKHSWHSHTLGRDQNFSFSTQRHRTSHCFYLSLSFILVLFLSSAFVGVASAAFPNADCNGNVNSSQELRDCLTQDTLHDGLLELADVSLMGTHPDDLIFAPLGNRYIGTSGYDASVEWVAGLLEDWGYDVSTESFDIVFRLESDETPNNNWQIILHHPNNGDQEVVLGEVSRPFLTELDTSVIIEDESDLQAAIDAVEASVSGGTAALDESMYVPIDVSSLSDPNANFDSGCQAVDYNNINIAGKIALVQRGACSFRTKVLNAVNAGAAGIVIFNDGRAPDREQAIRIDLQVEAVDDPVLNIPSLFARSAIGYNLTDLHGTADEPKISMNFEVKYEIRTVTNVFGDKSSLNNQSDHVLYLGGHLDSERYSPGMNDNGTMVITSLAIAHAIRNTPLRHNVRFVFWGGEEAGWYGSRLHLQNLTEKQRKKIIAYLNAEHIASPNYVRGIGFIPFNASVWPGSLVDGINTISKLYTDYLSAQNLPFIMVEAPGGSDDRSFIDVNIPAQTNDTGLGLLEGAKNQAYFDMFGGYLNEPLDACYHTNCDTYPRSFLGLMPYYLTVPTWTNLSFEQLELNMQVYEEMSDAIAHVFYSIINDANAKGLIVSNPK